MLADPHSKSRRSGSTALARAVERDTLERRHDRTFSHYRIPFAEYGLAQNEVWRRT
jgi:hypothetical protein